MDFAKFFVSLLLLASISVEAATVPKEHAPADPTIDWDSFGFSLNGVRTDSMWLNRVRVQDNGEAFYSPLSDECLTPLGKLEIHPAAAALNYGQSLFEGLKAFRRADGSIAMFRPGKNAERMQQGARRFLLPPIPTETFVQAADAVVRANAAWVPPFGKGALYLRPMLMGTAEDLGVKPSSESTFLIYCSPVGNYFKGELQAIRLQAVQGFSRAATGGSGSVKAGGNYAPAFLVQRQVRQRGYDDILCLDAASGEAVEEAGASNFFAVYSDGESMTVVTPSLDNGTILPGVTRASILELAEREFGCKVVERRLLLTDLCGASEAFCCGTGASITPVGSVSVANSDGVEIRPEIAFGDGKSPGPLTQRLYKTLLDLQTGTNEMLNEKYRDWIHVVDP